MRAILFIHCDADEPIPVHHSRDLRAASFAPQSDLWIAKGCGHVGAYDLDPAAYDALLLSFIEGQLH